MLVICSLRDNKIGTAAHCSYDARTELCHLHSWLQPCETRMKRLPYFFWSLGHRYFQLKIIRYAEIQLPLYFSTSVSLNIDGYFVEDSTIMLKMEQYCRNCYYFFVFFLLAK
ncbi:PREDICTED: uncharacterized protein LOC105145486 [Acromyrmex echinatior]|uniref:uncharacterized protein LOC105145486 n=1 Tax=Acromyrmex echinatior TaxID=103372 RepID=UPI000580BE41|nr:PREDICTED: uncharacterized protein LOC105145486 [Acromyrmex echinatior]